jgi:multiple sugar transport system permease protein
MLGDVSLAPWAIIIVDTWMWTPYVMLICLAGLRSIPTTSTRRPRSTVPRLAAVLVDHGADGLPFIMLAVLFRGIENFKMFDMVTC